MQPTPEDTTVSIPITFDYKGGRNENSKNKWILLAVMVVVTIILTIGIISNDNMELWKKIGFIGGMFYIVLLFLRFVVFHELYYSDLYETLKELKNILPITSIWNIFDIEWTRPYIVYYKNGTKGIFVKMEKDAITGKGEMARYDHYEAISDAYNLSHSLNMNIRHIDYMDTVGNDSRMQSLYDNLSDIENPDMADMMIDIYDNLQDEMSHNYSSFDIYLFLTRDKTENFIYNVQNVCATMLGGNFITYRILNRNDIRTVCMALFNLLDFSVTDACEEILQGSNSSNIVPIRVINADGSVEKLNKTQQEKRIEAEERERKERERKEEAKKNKRRRKTNTESNEITVEEPDEDIDLFG